MSNVSLEIGGKSFAVACAEGEEQHVARLGRMIDDKLGEMGDTGTQSESRMLLFAALLLADDLHEKEQGQTAPIAAAVTGLDKQRLEVLADRLENLASRLEA